MAGLELNKGDIVAKRYRIEEQLGTGAMGSVFLASDQRLQGQDDLVALKFVRLPDEKKAVDETGQTVELEKIRAEFEEKTNDIVSELKTAYRIQHPNICRLHTAEQDSYGRYFIVMEYIEGQTVYRMLETLKAAEESSFELALESRQKRVIDIGSQLCRGLAAVHAEKIIHRDVKPGNIMIDKAGQVRLLDFGVAARFGTTGSAGTLNYMAPEQLVPDGTPISERTDLFGVGVVLYEVLTGVIPHEPRGMTFHEKCMDCRERYRDGVPTPSERLGRQVDSRLEEIILQCLGFDALDRPASATEVADRLEECRRERWQPAKKEEIPGRSSWWLTDCWGKTDVGDLWWAVSERGDRRIYEIAQSDGALGRLEQRRNWFERVCLRRTRIMKATRTSNLREAPYFLEYDAGSTLAEWVEKKGGVSSIPLETRLMIFIGIAKGVQEIHEAGEVHGELRPAHVFVFDEGDSPAVELARFGTLETASRQDRPDLYLSAAVGRGEKSDISSDLYALGILLYQLTIGDLWAPLEVDWEERVQDEILVEDIRGLLSPSLDPTTAESLIQRLGLLPERRTERAQKKRFQKRSFIYTRIAAAAMILLIAGGGLYWRLENQRRAISEVTDFLQSVFTVSNPEEMTSIGAGLTASQLLEWGVWRLGEGAVLEAAELDTPLARMKESTPTVEAAISYRPKVKAELLHRIGLAFQGLAQWDASRKVLERAFELGEEVHGPEDSETAEIANTLSDTLRLQEELVLARERNAWALEQISPRGARYSRFLGSRAGIHVLEGDFDSAIRSYQEAISNLDGRESLESRKVVATLHQNLGVLLTRVDQIQPAKVALETALSVRESLARETGGDPATVPLLEMLGLVELESGNPIEANEKLQRALLQGQQIYGSRHPVVAGIFTNLGWLYEDTCEYGESEAAYLAASEIMEGLYGESHSKVADSLQSLAFLQASRGQLDAAEENYRRASKIRQDNQPENHPDILVTKSDLAWTLRLAGRLEEAEVLYRQAMEAWRDVWQDPFETAYARLNLAAVLWDLERFEEAAGEVDSAERAWQSIEEEEGGKDGLGWASEAWAELFEAQGNYEKGAEHHRNAMEIFRHTRGDSSNRFSKSKVKYARALVELGRPSEAATLLGEVVSTYKGTLLNADNHWRMAHARAVLGRALISNGEEERGREMLESAYARLLELRGPTSEYTRDAARYRALSGA